MKKLERKISIIIPAYNAEKTIKKCLESIIENNYSNKEIIIVNNESTDNSLKIINYKDEVVINSCILCTFAT